MAMEKLGQLVERGRVGPDRRRHPAVALGAGLPRRPEPARPLPGRTDDPRAHRARARRRQGLPQGRDGQRRRARARVHQGARRRAAARPVLVRVRAGVDVRRVPRARPAHLRAAQGARAPRSSWSPRPSRTRCARRPTSSSGSRTSGCRWPGWSSTGCTAPSSATCRPARAEAAADALAAKPDDPATRLAEAALRVHAELAASAEHDARMTRRFGAAHPGVALVSVPALPADVHDLDGLREIGDAARASDGRELRAAPGANLRFRRPT